MSAIAGVSRTKRRHLVRALVILLLFLSPWLPALALSPNKSISQYASSMWQTDAGLPELAVESILETPDGYLWVGTQEGLARFDGQRFTVYDHVNTPQLRSDLITALVVDGQGTLWIGTSNGLATRQSDGTFSAFSADDGLPGNRIFALAVDRDDSIWIGTLAGLAHMVDGKVASILSSSNGLLGDMVTSLVLDQDGALWIGTRDGLNRLDHGVLQAFTTADGLPGNRISMLYLTHAGDLWVISLGQEMARRVRRGFGDWWPGDVHFEQWWPQGLPHGTHIRAVCEDRDGNVWFATDTQGLFRSWQELLSPAAPEQGLTDMSLETLYEDSTGNLWIGTLGRGLLRFRDGSFTTYTKEEGLTSNSAFSVVQDTSGDVWVGTFDGLTKISADETRRYGTNDGLSNNYISALGVDHSAGVWIGMAGAVLDHFVDGKLQSGLRLKPHLPTSLVDAIVQDRNGTLWVGLDGGGLAQIVGNDVRYFTTADGLPDNFVNALVEDGRGDIWVGTNNGLGRVHGGVIVPDPLHDATLRESGVLSLHIDDTGTLWIGTLARGLFRVDGSLLTRITMAQGLPNETINSILTDAQNNLWLGSNRGIFRVDRQDLDDLLRGHNNRLSVIHFGQADGMKSAETSAGRQPSAWRAADGRLWFATVEGVVVVDPEHIERNVLPLPTYIESLRADEELIDRRDPMSLKPGTSRIEIRYTSPDLTAAESTRFRYRLSGVDEQWVEVAGERVARYAHVPPGARHFEVQTAREGGDWNEEHSAAVDFFVAPMFYQTWWFRVLCVVAFVLLLALLHHVRVAWLRMNSAVAEERRRIAGEIHDSLAQGFSAISVQIEAALGRMQRAPDLAANHLRLARDVSRSSLTEARRSVWNLQSPPPTESSLRDSIAAACEQFAYGQGVNLQADVSGHAWVVSPAAENHLLRIAQEAVSNAIHHGRARNVRVSLEYTFHQFTLRVSDDGVGFDPAVAACAADRGFGLTSMRRRAESMKGGFNLQTAPQQGTCVMVTIPRLALLNRLWSDLRGRPGRRIS